MTMVCVCVCITAGSMGAEGAAAPLACSPRKNGGAVLKNM